jgi:hypothetical protein
MVSTQYWSLLGPRVRFPEGAHEMGGRDLLSATIGVPFGRVLMGARPFEVGAYRNLKSLIFAPHSLFTANPPANMNRVLLAHRLRLSACDLVED